MKLKLALCIPVLLFFTPVGLYAAHCSATATSMSFGEYDVFSTNPTDSRGSITVRCNGPEKHEVFFTISMTTGNSGTYSPRKMTRVGDAIEYNIFTNPAGTEVWGDGTDRSATVSGTGWKDAPRQFYFYGRIPGGQDVAAGSYTDSVTVSVEW